MADPFVGEIRAVAFNYAPEGWNFCDGSILQVSMYQALYALLGNVYGGTAPNTFAVPDLRGRMIAGVGAGPNLAPVYGGQMQGANTLPILTGNLPPHTHAATVKDPGHNHGFSVPNHTHGFNLPSHTHQVSVPYNSTGAGGGTVFDIGTLDAPGTTSAGPYTTTTSDPTITGTTGNPTGNSEGCTEAALTEISVVNTMTGSGLPIEIQPPSTGLYYIIATQGIWPPKP